MALNDVYSAVDHYLYVTTSDDLTFALEGESDGDFFTVTYPNDSVTAVEGAKGNVQFSQKKQSLGNITYSNQWGSISNKNLNQVFFDQQAGNTIKKIEFKRITQNENITIFDSSRAFISKTPDYVTGSTANDRGWVFLVEGLEAKELTAPV